MAVSQTKSIRNKIFNGEITLAVGIIWILGIMLIPMPALLLDLLLSTNITISVLILFVALYTIEPLEFSIFPSVLLITTLFRLALNVASTRLILIHGNEGTGAAGRVIEVFGNFVVGGNLFIGMIVFMILVIINFIVITKGAGRIAEVQARFTLDALPGKQMAIDADLNAGIIDDKAAQSRRGKIQREADFYGAMDGASKFVRGDAIAGIIITAINIIGGLLLGVTMYNMDVSSAAETFTRLTIGDGLVSQIPALIISTAAGISVSKAGGENRLGTDFGTQLLGNTKALTMSSATLMILGMVPGMPIVPFWSLGIVFGTLAWKSKKQHETEENKEEARVQAEETEKQKESAEEISDLLPIDLLGLELGYALIPLVDPEQDGELLERVKAIRRQVALDMGFVVPPVHIKDNLQLEPGAYSIIIKGIEVGKGEMMVDHYLAMKAGEVDEEIDGIDTVEPAFGLPAVWVSTDDRERAQIAGYTVVDIPTVISTHITEIIKNHAFEFLSRQQVQKLLDQTAKNEPKLVEELIPDLLSVGATQRIFQNLLKENVSVRDIGTILETLADQAQFTKNSEVLSEFVRASLSRNITKQYLNEEGVLPVITMNQNLENQLTEAIHETNQGSYLALNPTLSQKVISWIEQGVEVFSQFNYQPIILCSPLLRPHLKKLTERVIPNLVVLSHNEISHDARIKSLGVIEAEEGTA